MQTTPDDAVLVDVDEDDISEDTLRADLESGGLNSFMVHGCWAIWKTESGFCGNLSQHHSITESFSDLSLDAATEMAREWALYCRG